MATITGKRFQMTDGAASPVNLFPYTVSEAVYGLNNSISNAISSALSAISLSTYAGSSAIGSATQPVYYNGSALVATDLSTTYAPYNSAGYLPLTGGTINGSLSITGELSVSSNIYLNSSLAFGTSSSITGYLNSTSAGGLRWYDQSDWRTVWHSGNLDVSTFARVGILTGDLDSVSSPGFWVSGEPDSTFPSGMTQGGSNLIQTKSRAGVGAQLFIPQLLNRMFLRYSTSAEWREFAFTDSNVASATKLQTARTIWGQSFDGTSDVSGNLTLGNNLLYQSGSDGVSRSILDIAGNTPIIGYGFSVASKDVYYTGYNVHINTGGGYSTGNGIDILANGNVGIGTDSPTQKLHVVGNILSTGDQIINSDLTMKMNLKDVTYSVSDIAKCRAVTFDWKDGHGHSAGSIAQDWKPLIPELVHGEEGGMTLAYGQIALVNSIIEAREIERLKERVAELEQQLKMRS